MKLYQSIGTLFSLITACRAIAERIDAELTIEAMKNHLDRSKFQPADQAPKLWPGFYAQEFREIVFHLNISHKPFICIVDDWYLAWDRQAASACGNPIVNALYSLYCQKADAVIQFLKTEIPQESPL